MKFNEQWTSMMSTWYENQQTLFNSVASNMEALTKTKDSSAADISNQVIDFYKNISDNMLQSFEAESLQLPMESLEKSVRGNPIAETLLESVKELWQSSKGIPGLFSAEGAETSYKQSLENLMNPASWLKSAGGDLDLSVERLSEGPAFAGFWDVDKKVVSAQASWIESRTKSNAYHMVVLKAWCRAFEAFAIRLKDYGEEGEGDVSLRNIIDLWLGVANDELTEMHKSEEFLQAQRDMIRAGMQYRLNEREVAEDLCELLHVPSRGEIDELHKTVTELRREVRRLNKLVNQQQPKQAPAAKPKTATKKAPAKKTSAASTSARKPAARRTRKTTAKPTETK